MTILLTVLVLSVAKNNNLPQQTETCSMRSPVVMLSPEKPNEEKPNEEIIDRRSSDDTLSPPIFRYPSNYYPRPPLRDVTNIPTRGDPDSFSYLGNLYREFDNKIMRLYGRRRYDDIWDYYAIFNTQDAMITKVSIKTRNDRELFDGDELVINMFEKDGPFRVHFHKKDEFAYSPYVF
jgi:hypothetical protein